ncbi:hypothetical protein F511_26347 [Dorcoceras hygrometricum]|uniref:Uncharacterized protein n=1 Tax=Dorcoceras hygrometricum TaxID=472368 RepID=A0A2Z7D640_9LAMI|nr:hypothetical protein F511_26347 [Dorcoceras hygrometricum]
MHEDTNESMVSKAQQRSCAESDPVIFRYDRSSAHQSLMVFRCDNTVGHHINISVGPFRHDGSAGRSQRTKGNSVHRGIKLNMKCVYENAKQIVATTHYVITAHSISSVITSSIRTSKQLPPRQISQEYTAPASYSNLLLYQLTRNSTEDVYKLESAKTSNNQLTSKLIQLTSYSRETQPNLKYTTAQILQPLRAPSTRRLKSSNRYQSKDLKETSSAINLSPNGDILPVTQIWLRYAIVARDHQTTSRKSPAQNQQITRTHRPACKHPDLAFIKRSCTRVRLLSNLMLAKRHRITHTLPTPNLIHAKRHRITYTQPAHLRVIQNDIVLLSSQGNSLKHTRDGSGHPDLIQYENNKPVYSNHESNRFSRCP